MSPLAVFLQSGNRCSELLLQFGDLCFDSRKLLESTVALCDELFYLSYFFA